ncbi:MAG: hypothetical protein IJ228_13395 [Succinivibrio sp.]|nr:hypothetical protein [Succinivibrio sp.]
MKFFAKIFLVLSAAFLLASCAYKHQAVENVSGVVPAGLTSQQVEEAIVKAAVEYNWQIVSKESGAVVLQQLKNKYSATVKVVYDTANWAVQLVSATGLNYDKSNNTVHSHYNVWARNLGSEIDKNLKTIAAL